MDFFKTLTNAAKGLGKAVTPHEETVEKPVMIMMVKEAPRTRREQLHDMLNDGRDTDRVARVKGKLDEVCNGKAFDTNTSSSFGLPKGMGGSRRRRGRNNTWRI